MTVSRPSSTAVDAAAGAQAGLGALRTGRGNLPLAGIDVQVEILGLNSRIELRQDFVNTFDVALEATYIFPLPERAAVTGMRLTAGGEVVDAALREREAARRAYDAAFASGRATSLVEEERPDVFTMRIGNIVPGERVSIALTFVTPLSYQDGEATLRFPLVVAPRYVPGDALDGLPVGDGHADDTDAVPDASRISPPVLLPGFPHPVPLNIEIGIDPGGLEVSDVWSNLPTTTTIGGGRLRVQPGERADQDFILRLRYGTAVVTDSLVLVPDAVGEEGTYQLTVLPPTVSDRRQPLDLVLVVDHSASMAGWKMPAARRAATRIVDILGAADRFAVLTVADRTSRPAGLPAGLVDSSDGNRYRAIEHLARTDAAGGKELLPALRQALDLLRAGEDARDAIVVLITDGQVGNEDQLLRGLSSDLATARLHAIGIDRAANAGFLRRLADLGGGWCELVEGEERLDEVMQAIRRRIETPLAQQLSVGADGPSLIDDTTSPARLPDLYPGVPLVLTGRYRGPVSGSMTLRGNTADGNDWSTTVAAEHRDVSTVTAQWARAHLRDLEDRYVSAQGSEGGGSRQSVADRIVDTSLRFGVLCRFTAYVASRDGRVVAQGEERHRVLQPVHAPAGWDPSAGATTPPSAGETRMVKLRNVVAVAVTGLLLLGVGWIWSIGHGGPDGSPGSPASPRDGVVAGKNAPVADEPMPATRGGITENTVAPAPLAPPEAPRDSTTSRDIVTNGSLRLVVAEPAGAADRLVSAVTDAGGRVDSRTERSTSSSPTVDLVLRVPADKLDAILTDTRKLGVVKSMSIRYTDVTAQRVDLDARITALQTSVTRLLELMARAGTTADLLAAESSLTQRQAELDSLRAQRNTLHDEISYATINVNLSAEPTVSRTGFTGAVQHGWQSVISAGRGGLLAVGFLIPWLAVLAVPVTIGTVVLRRRRSRPS